MADTNEGSLEVYTHGAVARLATGLAWGLALYGLHQLGSTPWPVAHTMLFSACCLATFLWPLIILTSIGSLRISTAAIWGAASLFGLLALGAYDAWRNIGGEPTPSPSPQAIAAAGVVLFIGHRLVAASDAQRRWVASYECYFDLSWKAGLQWVMAALFTVIFWLLLYLGSALFGLIHLNFLSDLIKKLWFSIPVTTIAFAGGVHLTDVRVSLIRGVRTVLLTLLGWLLPLIVLLTVGFLIALPFTGLEPLWKTKAAGAILLAAAAWLIVLINMVFQDGAEGSAPVALKWSSRIAALALPILTALAGYALWLRVHQYGSTPQRVFGFATVTVSACYALGYAAASVVPGRWMRYLPPVNIAVAYVIIAVVLALFSPIADPARLSVNDQIAQLRAGVLTAAKFDYGFLRFRSVRYGREALAALKDHPFGPDASLMKNRADWALRQRYSWLAGRFQDSAAAAVHLNVYPRGAVAPKDFLNNLPKTNEPSCFYGSAPSCDLFLIDLSSDGSPEAALGRDSFFTLYKLGDHDHWTPVGSLNIQCAEDRAALREGRYTLALPLTKDLMINGRRIAPMSFSSPCSPPRAQNSR